MSSYQIDWLVKRERKNMGISHTPIRSIENVYTGTRYIVPAINQDDAVKSAP